MMGSRSGVKLSGPQKSRRISESREQGTRSMAFSMYGAMRSQSGSRVPKEKSRGIPSRRQGAQTGSNSPTISPPPSSR